MKHTLLVSAIVLGCSANAASEMQPATLEEVIVTAQKRSENLQRAPAAITVISGYDLVAGGVTDIRGAQNLVPSVRFQAENASTEIYVRGVGSTLDLPNIEPPTSFNLDGIYIPREATGVALFDIAQLEVLPGPQGTLYGRSSLGGAVNVTLQRPTQSRESHLLLETGADSLLHGSLVQNMPLNERTALRGAIDYRVHDGLQATGANSSDDLAVRLSALHEADNGLSIHVWSQGAKQEGKSPNLVRRGFNAGRFDGDPGAFDSGDPWNDTIAPDAPNAGKQHYENLVTGARVDYALGDTTLTYVPSYLYLDWTGHYWLENLPSLLSAHYNQITQELRAAGSAGQRWQWLAGLYGYRVTNDGRFIVAGFPLADISRNRLEGMAAFGEATYSPAKRLRLRVGGRYSSDARDGAGITALGQPYSAHQSFDRTDWKLGADFDAGKSAMFYAAIQTAYQPGTYNLFQSTAAADNRVAPARLTAYTAGMKRRLARERLQLNGEAYYYDYRDLLVQSFNLNTSLLTTFNAQAVEIYGSQLDIRLQATPRSLLSASIGYLHARNDRFVVPPDIDIGPGTRDFAGYALQYAPDWTVSAELQHDIALGAGYVRALLQSRYESAFWGTFNQARGTRQDSYTKSAAALTYHAAGERWSLGAWIRNIENEPVLAATTTGQFGPYADAFLEPPRSYGVRFTLAL